MERHTEAVNLWVGIAEQRQMIDKMLDPVRCSIESTQGCLRPRARATWPSKARTMDAAALTLTPLLPSLRAFASSSGFEEQIRMCAQVAVGRRPAADASATATAAGIPTESSAALVSLFLEAARLNASAGEVEEILGGVLPVERARAIAAIATEGSLTMRAALESLSLGPAELVDVSWHRATIAAAGGELPRPGGTPLYTITLTTRAPDGSTRPLQFTATIEELTDFVR